MYDAARRILNDGHVTRSNGGNYRRGQLRGNRFRDCPKTACRGCARGDYLDDGADSSSRARTGCGRRGRTVFYRRSHGRNRGTAIRRFGAFARGAEPDFDYAAHGVSNDARGLAGDGGTKVWANCECDFGDGAAGEQPRLRGLWRGQGGDGWDDAGRG